ncbi:winged helix-turn-helix domain-containing protein [Microbacterium deminutum]|uniref:Winged helix-turn-helix domain-containing protein n=1 Tax=Microbacterium deminutum TaxID=344164 RepID=A0ABP5C281_9MICO
MTEPGEERIELKRGDPEGEARLRALSSPLRLRVLRLCAFESRTNKELAELLGVNPGSMLHHVRTLVQTGYLAAEPERAGAQGAREIPYRATGLSWRTPMPGGSRILVETFLQQIEGVDDEELDTTWLGLKLNAEHKAELEDRLYAIVTEFKERGPDADGATYSLFTALHPDLNPPSASS